MSASHLFDVCSIYLQQCGSVEMYVNDTWQARCFCIASSRKCLSIAYLNVLSEAWYLYARHVKIMQYKQAECNIFQAFIHTDTVRAWNVRTLILSQVRRSNKFHPIINHTLFVFCLLCRQLYISFYLFFYVKEYIFLVIKLLQRVLV